jgi:hypothetical protein
MVAENMAALTRRPETKELGESFGERFAQLLLSTPINHDCVFTFLNNFAALDVCDGYVGQMTVWLHRMFPTDPVRASDALLQLAIRRSGILLTQHADAVPAFAAFLPGLSFPEQSANLVAALICLVSVAPNPEPLGGICMAIGDHLIQSIATVVRQQNIRECTKLMVAFHTMVEIVPEIAEGSMVRRFTDSLVNSILRGFGDILIINDDTDAAFQGELCRFIALALARGWMNDLAIIIDWCEGMICAELATVHHFMVFPFLPIEQMPATATFLRELQVTDSADFNQLLIPLLKGFAERGVFTAFFQPQIVFQLINFAWPGPKDAVAMDVLFPILEKNLVPESEFYTACFEFLLGFGFRFRVPCIHHKIADLLTLIASKFEDRTPLKTIVAACCDANATIVKEFVSAVIDRQPPDVHRTAAEQLYRAFVMT